MSTADYSYEALRAALSGAGAATESAELHGGVCAGLCVGGPAAAGAWSQAWLSSESEAAPDAQLREQVQSLENDSWQAMSSGEFRLELILPDDDTDLPERVAALASWCHGFVGGLGVAGLSFAEHSPSVRAQLEEIVADFTEISRASTDVEDIVEGGFQLASIIEFVRAGVQIVFETLLEQREARMGGRLH